MKKLMILVAFCCALLAGCVENQEPQKNQQSIPTDESNEQGKEIEQQENAEEEKRTGNKIKKEKPNGKLSKKEYMRKCKSLGYNKVFFGKKDLTGQLVKLNVFVKDNLLLDYSGFSLSDYEFQEKWKIRRELYECSVKRKNSNSYAGMGSLKLYFSSKKNYKLDTSWISSGKKFVVYGEVVGWSNNTWDGYNEVGVVARFIER